jgi:hypothetical protein
MAVDVRNAGAIYVEDHVVRDGPIVTGVYFGYLPEYMRVFMEAVVEAPCGRESRE